jgi:tetratricopeptide (TPR) repeat protein
MPDQLMELDLRKPVIRLVVILTLVFALVWSWYVVCWYIGNTIAESLSVEESSIQTASQAVSLGPNDPLTHWTLGQFTQAKLPLDQTGLAEREYAKAVSLSPNDYRFWMAYGTALEQAGDNERAEKALRRAIELAPAYSYPRWYLGNLLLRSGRDQEAFTELQRASEADPELRGQLFTIAWQVHPGDIDSLKAAVGPNPEARAQFAQYLIAIGKFDEGLRLWNTLTETEKKQNRTSGEALIDALAVSKHFHQAVDVWNDLIPTPAYRAAIGQLIDGGFEESAYRGRTSFGWRFQSTQQLQISIDSNQAHSGSRSLRLVFQVRSHVRSINLAQVAAIQPNTQYDLECYVKTQNLEGAGTPVVLISDANDGTILATSVPAANGTSDWQRIDLMFKSGEKSEAVSVGMGFSSCGDNSVCPLFGTVWYDDFTLKHRN